MLDPRTLLALAGSPQQGEANPFGSLILMALIFGTIESVDPDFLMVRIAEKTRIKVLKSAVAGPQGPAPATEKK